jgi:hypothetical protein
VRALELKIKNSQTMTLKELIKAKEDLEDMIAEKEYAEKEEKSSKKTSIKSA